MSKTNPKKFAQLCRKLVVLSDLLIDVVDEIEQYGHDEKQFKADLNKVREKCCKTVQSAFTVENVLHSTYLQNLSNQIDTVIRKNFEINK